MKYDFVIVGAGFAGSVCARELSEAGHTVLVIDKRPHIGGNAHDIFDEHNVLIHTYGPHIFHTNSKRVFEYLSRFTDWRFYEHRVLAKVDEQLLPIPINRTTVNSLYGLELTDGEEVQKYYDSVREQRDPIKTSEDVVLNSVGADLCNKFFRGYTKKQWGLDLSELSAGVASRIPTRTNDDDRYFSDNYQFMPAQGYTAMFEKMLDHTNITVRLSTEFAQLSEEERATHIVFCGPIDEYFNYCYGRLPYRSLRFEHRHLSNVENYQKTGTINFPNDYNYTRITEFKHLTGQQHEGTSVVFEYPQSEGDPYYPIPRPENENLFRKYLALADEAPNVTFVGRLAQYRYYNMDQIVATALKSSEELLKRASN